MSRRLPSGALLHELQLRLALSGGAAHEVARRGLQELLHRVAGELVEHYLLQGPGRMDRSSASNSLFSSLGGIGRYLLEMLFFSLDQELRVLGFVHVSKTWAFRVADPLFIGTS